jgi:hypothetical protein
MKSRSCCPIKEKTRDYSKRNFSKAKKMNTVDQDERLDGATSTKCYSNTDWLILIVPEKVVASAGF